MANSFGCDPAAVNRTAESLTRVRMAERPARPSSGTGVAPIDAALTEFERTAWQAESAAHASTERAATLLRQLAEGTLETDRQLANQVTEGNHG